MSSFSVRKTDLTDENHCEAFVNLLDSYAKDPMGGGIGLASGVKKRLIKDLVKRNDFISLLVFEKQSNTAIGLLNAFEAYSTFQAQTLINIHDVYIEVGYRGTGAVDKLFDHITRVAIERNCCKLTLEVLSKNLVAQRCYRRFGFQGYALNTDTGQALFWQKKLMG